MSQGGKYHGTMIHVPPELPEILKQFTKMAIRTQPSDVLAWSAAYFRALSSGEAFDGRWKNKGQILTPSLLRVLNKQLGPLKVAPLSLIFEKWIGLALPKDQFDALVDKGHFMGETDWTKFFAVACFFLARDVRDAMAIACDVMTSEADGRIPFLLFVNIYRYLAPEYYGVNQGHVDYIIGYLEETFVRKQNGFILPKNFLKSECPSLAG